MPHPLLAAATLLMLAVGPAHAMQASEPLLEQDKRFLEMVRSKMDRELKREHTSSGNKRYHPPRVSLDLNRRALVITNRFKRNPDADARRAVKHGVSDHQPALCAALLPSDMRRTLVSIVLRVEMRSGSLIGQTTASPQSCR